MEAQLATDATSKTRRIPEDTSLYDNYSFAGMGFPS